MLTKIAFCAALISMLCGCSNDDTGAKNTDPIRGQAITLGVWKGSPAEERALNQMLADFSQKTGVIVRTRIYANINQQLTTELIGGSAPDVFYIDSSTAVWHF